jgi:hypothetical protein
MSALLARTKPDANGDWDFIGIFEYDDVNEDTASLFYVIDEVTDPHNCEFCFLDFGMGIFFDKEHVIEADDAFDLPVAPFFSERLDMLVNDKTTIWFDIDFTPKEAYDFTTDAQELNVH